MNQLTLVRRYPDMPTAADVVNALDQQALASILRTYGEEKHAKKIAAAIVQARSLYPVTRTQQLAGIVAGALINSKRVWEKKRCICMCVCACVCVWVPWSPRGVYLYLKSCRVESCLSSFMPAFFGFASLPPPTPLSHKQFFKIFCSLLISLIIEFFVFCMRWFIICACHSKMWNDRSRRISRSITVVDKHPV